ncbi:MAG: V-type ATPase 116kDa subunit family protein [Lutisporaceae bacterium]
MAVERMKVISIIGNNSDIDSVARMIVINGNIHMLNAISELNNNCLELKASEDNIDALQELVDIKPYYSKVDFSEDEKIIQSFHSVLDLKQEIVNEYIDSSFDYHNAMDNLKKSYETIKNTVEKVDKLTVEIELKQTQIVNLHYARTEGLDIGALLGLKHFEFDMFTLSREKYKKLKLNYENIPSVIIHLGVVDDKDVVAAITPKEFMGDAERIFTSLNIMKLDIPQGYTCNTESIMKTLEAEIRKAKSDIEELKKSVQSTREQYEGLIKKSYTMLLLEQKIEHVKSEMAIGKKLFFVFGFIPISQTDEFKHQIKDAMKDEAIVLTEAAENRKFGHSPPTKLINNVFFRPFETLVKMYGIPSYNEKDPTPFFAISYMLMFGAMFGDLGQGFVILLGGLILKYRMKNNSFGGILTRLGASSMLFGLLYGSLFGNEEVIPHLLIRPMENINTVLISAVVLGIILINISYIYSFLNLYQRRDLEEGLFGKEGLTGFLFFWGIIAFIGDKLLNIFGFPTIAYLIILVILLLIMVVKQPLARYIQGEKELYEEAPGDYYLEAGFGVVETILSVVSNIISFIRVGAFALNHVGLYIAFATMAKMVSSYTVGVFILILGNILIIGLEGLVVFIQGLRLEYYELFSRYYSGYGIPYKPIKLTHYDD